MAALTFTLATNHKQVGASPGSTAWRIVSTDGNFYASLALLLAAGKTPFPGLDPGLFAQYITIRTVTAANAGGSAFYWAVNLATAPAAVANANFFQSGAGQTLQIPGHAWNVWVSLTTSTDLVMIDAAY